MNTTEMTYTYTPASPFGARGNVLAPPAGAAALPAVAGQRFLTVAEVCDLIDAAGPLTISDLAAGLGAGVRETGVLVDWLERHGDLRRDEWDRFRLSGMCRGERAA